MEEKYKLEKRKKRRNYYICENNPGSCDYISWNKPKPGEKYIEGEEKPEIEEKPKKTRKKRQLKRKSNKKR